MMLLSVICAWSAFAGLNPGPVVPEGMAVLPVGDVNGDGLTDLIHDRYVLLNAGGGSFTKRDLGLAGTDSAVEWIDVNGDGRADLLTGDRPMNGPGIDPAARKYRIYIAGAPEAIDRWTLAREGVFGVEENATRTVEAVLENDLLSFRFTAPWVTSPIEGSLTRVDGTFTGTVEAETTCGWVNIQVTATQH
jgi:hypothetical protein